MAKYISVINISRVLRAIRLNGRVSRIALSKLLEIDKSTVTSIVTRLIDQGIILEAEVGKASSKGGRKPVSLIVNKSYGSVLGMEIQSQFYRLVVLNLEGEIIYHDSQKILIDKDNILSSITEIIERVSAKISENNLPPLLGAGIGITGVVNFHQGIIYHSKPLNIDEPMELSEQLSDHFSFPVMIENDANCCGWGELAFRKLDLLKDVLCVLVQHWNDGDIPDRYARIGVGLGIVINGKVHHGQDYSSGEFRSFRWHEPCRSQFGIDDGVFQNIAEDTDAFQQFAKELAENIAMMVNTMNFSTVIIAGALKDKRMDLMQQLAKAIKQNWPYSDGPNCDISEASNDEFVVAYGAAGMFLERLFEQPEIPDQEESSTFPPNGLQILFQRDRAS